jgi:hypothetical protein
MRIRIVISFKQLLHKASAINRKTRIWIGLGLLAVSALHIYYVQELLAALILFSLLFVAVSAAALTIFLSVHASKPVIIWAAPKVLRAAHWGADAVQGAIANEAWTQGVSYRLRRERLRWNEKYKRVYLRSASIKANYVDRVGLRAGGRALTVGLSQQTRMSKRLGNWLTQRVSYSDLIHLKSRSHVVRPCTRRHRRASEG